MLGSLLCKYKQCSCNALLSRLFNFSSYKKLVNHSYVFNCIGTFLKGALSKERKSILLFKTLPPAEAFCKYFKQVKDFQVAHAKFKPPLYNFCNGKTDILCATDKLISEGIDIPSADALFLVTQNSSSLISLQALGRVLRPAEGKRRPVIVDVSVRGYDPFENASIKRANLWTQITKDVKFLSYTM